MTARSELQSIAPGARELLAWQYDTEGKPWFAHDIRKGSSKQFDVSLRVISMILKENTSA